MGSNPGAGKLDECMLIVSPGITLLQPLNDMFYIVDRSKGVKKKTKHSFTFQIETFFVHLRREALDMIGDSNACREPKKQPFFRFVDLDDEKTSKKSGNDDVKDGSDVIKSGSDATKSPTR